MTGVRPRRGFDWEAAGREIGATLDALNAVVVVGLDPVATGRVAIGVGRAQAVTRRVAVGDLFAESPPIQELVTSDDPHGLVDSFLYGVSLSRIAYEVPDAGQLYVMPSGTEPPTYDEILPNPRWHRLAAGFREVGALLVLAVPANAEKVEQLVEATDGAILVGEAVPRKLPVARVVGTVREPRPESAPTPAGPPPKARRRTRGRVAAVIGITLTLALAGVAAWLAYRPLAGAEHLLGRKQDTTGGHPAVAAPVPLLADSTAGANAPAMADSQAAVGPIVTVPLPANPADSTQAAAFAIELLAANTEAGAILKLQKDGKKLPAATFAPIDIQGARWFKVVAGALPTRADADTLLAGLRRRKMLDSASGQVVRLPFAFLIDSGVPATAVPGMIATYVYRGQPVYALRQANGSAWLLAGAFETPEQATLYAESLRASGTAPVLVYRKGRSF